MTKEQLAEIYKKYNDIIGLADGRISMDNHMNALAKIQEAIVKEQEEVVQIEKDLLEFNFDSKIRDVVFNTDLGDDLERNFKQLLIDFTLFKAKL